MMNLENLKYDVEKLKNKLAEFSVEEVKKICITQHKKNYILRKENEDLHKIIKNSEEVIKKLLKEREELLKAILL